MKKLKINGTYLTIIIISLCFSISSLYILIRQINLEMMPKFDILNCTVYTTAMFVLTVAMTVSLMERTKKVKLSDLFVNFLFTIIRAMFYLFSFTVNVNSHLKDVIPLNYTLTILSYLVHFSLIISFLEYLAELFSVKLKRVYFYQKILYILQVIVLVVFLLNIKFGFMFSAHSGEYDKAMYARFSFISTLMMIIGICPFYFGKKIDDVSKFSFFSYTLIPVVASILQIINPEISFFPMGLLLSACILFVHAHVRQNLTNQQQKALYEKQKTAIMLSQIQPHFLYNSLSSIACLCESDPKKAKKTAITFTKYLRSNLDSLSSEFSIPFEKELEHTKAYLEIEQIRFPKRLSVEYDIKVSDFLIPPLTLQPMAENAVKHGICKKEDGGTVRISTLETKDSYIITVSDDGVGFDESELSEKEVHIGISNVRQRLDSMANGTLTIESQKGVGTSVKLILPKE